MEHEALLFDDIRDVLAQQFSRITEVERDLLIWLAIEREPMTSSAVGANFAQPPTRRSLLEAQRSLYRRSLVEQEIANELGKGEGEVKLSLQNVVLEYVTNTLLETLSAELESEALNYFLRYALVKAQAKDYIRAVQQRLILQPIAQRLQQRYGLHGVEARLQQLLNKLHKDATLAAGYGAANLLHLALALDIKLRGWNFSQLVIWQADLRTAAVAGVNFRGAELRAATFIETFGIVKGIAISSDGRYLAAGGADGNVFLWQMSDADYRLHRVLQGHTQPVGSLAFAPQGALLASVGFDGRICLWDATTGEPLATRLAHTNTVAGIAFSGDGRYVASGGADRRVVIWDWQCDEIFRCLEETAWINGLVFSPDGRLLIVAKDDKQANVWDWRNGTLLQTLRGHVDKILAVACSPDGRVVATGGEDKRICLWQLGEPDGYRVLSKHTGWIWSLAFSPDSTLMVSASADLTIRLWDVATGRVRRTLVGHTGWVSAVAYLPDGARIASGGYDQTIRLWDESSGQVVRTFHGHLPRVDYVVFSKDGTLLASGGLDGPIQLWCVESRRQLQRLVGHGGAIRAVAFSVHNQVIAGGCDDHRVYLWDIKSGRLKQMLLGHTDLVRHVAFSPDEQYLVTGSYDRTLRIWEVATGRLCHIVRQAHAKLQATTVFSPDGAVLAYGSYDNSVKLLWVATGTVSASLPIDSEEPVTVAFSAQGQFLVCATKPGRLWVWDVNAERTYTPKGLRLRIQTTIPIIWRILCSPNGRHLAVCGHDGAMQIFDLVCGVMAYTLPNESSIFNLTFSREGECLVTTSTENTLLVRNTSTGEVCQTLRGHLTELTALAGSPAKDMLASSSADGMVYLWCMVTGACLATLEPVGPYAGMNISEVTGISAIQRARLVALGAMIE